MSPRKWVDDIENAAAAEQADMDNQPTGSVIGCIGLFIIAMVVVAAVIVFLL